MTQQQLRDKNAASHRKTDSEEITTRLDAFTNNLVSTETILRRQWVNKSQLTTVKITKKTEKKNYLINATMFAVIIIPNSCQNSTIRPLPQHEKIQIRVHIPLSTPLFSASS